MAITFEYVIEGIECFVHADQFTQDPSVGIPLGPEELWAEAIDNGEEVPIPDALMDKLLQLATECFLDREQDYLEWQ